jgi:hypothetical protein
MENFHNHSSTGTGDWKLEHVILTSYISWLSHGWWKKWNFCSRYTPAKRGSAEIWSENSVPGQWCVRANIFTKNVVFMFRTSRPSTLIEYWYPWPLINGKWFYQSFHALIILLKSTMYVCFVCMAKLNIRLLHKITGQ